MNIFGSPKQKKDDYNKGVQDGAEKERLRQEENRQKFRLTELSFYLDKPVMIIPNEWTNPVIGFGKRIDFVSLAKTPVLVVEDYLRQEDMICQGALLPFSYQKFETILALNPYDLCALLYTNTAGFQEFSKPKSDVRDSREEIVSALRARGFFERVDQFLAQDAAEDQMDDFNVSISSNTQNEQAGKKTYRS